MLCICVTDITWISKKDIYVLILNANTFQELKEKWTKVRFKEHELLL